MFNSKRATEQLTLSSQVRYIHYFHMALSLRFQNILVAPTYCIKHIRLSLADNYGVKFKLEVIQLSDSIDVYTKRGFVEEPQGTLQYMYPRDKDGAIQDQLKFYDVHGGNQFMVTSFIYLSIGIC